MQKIFLRGRLLLLLAACLSLFPATAARAQAKLLDLSGTVRESGSNEPLAGANVVLYADTSGMGKPYRGAAANRYGFYAIPAFPAGTYTLVASSLGYETQKTTVYFDPANPRPKKNFELKKSAVQLGEVVVRDKRADGFSETSSTIDIEAAMVKQLPSLGGETDIFRALQMLPGVKAATEISTGIYVRGGSPDQNLTLIDGVNVYNPSHLGGFSSTFNPDAVQSISLIKGAFPAEYGGRLSSVLDVSMREGSRDRFQGSAGINLISSRVTLEGPVSPEATGIFSGRVMFLDRILSAVKGTQSIPRYHFSDFNGKVNYVLSENNRLVFSGFYSADALGDPPNSKDIGFDIGWSNATTNLTWVQLTTPVIFSTTSLMYTSYKFSTLLKDKIPGTRPLDFFTSSEIRDVLLKRDMTWFLNENHRLKSGVEAVVHSFTTTTSDYFIPELKYKPQYGTTIATTEASLYLQDEFRLFEGFQGNGGMRLYYFQNNRFLKLEPRFSFTWFFLDRFTLRGGFAMVHQNLHLLTRDDIYLPTDLWYPSTPNVKPARSLQGSLGFEAISYDRSFLFSLEGYYKDMSGLHEYKDNAQFAYGNGFDEQLTSGRGEAYGVEFFLNKRIGDFTGWAGYTLAWTRRYFPLLNRGLSYTPRYDRRHDISVVLTWNVARELSFGATWTYGTGQAFSLPIGQYSYVSMVNPFETKGRMFYEYSLRDAYRLPPFHKLDLSCKYTTEAGGYPLELSLNVYNAYNRFNAFSKYIGYRQDPGSTEKIPVLRQFTLFPFLPTFGATIRF